MHEDVSYAEFESNQGEQHQDARKDSKGKDKLPCKITQACAYASEALVDVARPAGFCYMLASCNISSATVDVTGRPFARYMVRVSHFAIPRYAPHPDFDGIIQTAG